MTNEEKISTALSMLQQLKWSREINWLSNAMAIDEVIQILKTPSTLPATIPGQKIVSRSRRAGLSDRLMALLGTRSQDARARKKQQVS